MYNSEQLMKLNYSSNMNILRAAHKYEPCLE